MTLPEDARFFVINRRELFAKFAGVKKDRAAELLDKYDHAIFTYDGTQEMNVMDNFQHVADKADIPRDQRSPEVVGKRFQELHQQAEDDDDGQYIISR
jgi:hypothetical protein